MTTDLIKVSHFHTYQHGKTTVLDFGLAIVVEEFTTVSEEERVKSNISRHRSVEQWIFVEKRNRLGLFGSGVSHFEGAQGRLAFSNWVRERQSAAEERNECCCSEGEFHGRKVLTRCEIFEETSCETMMRNFDDRLLSSVRRLRSILPSFPASSGRFTGCDPDAFQTSQTLLR